MMETGDLEIGKGSENEINTSTIGQNVMSSADNNVPHAETQGTAYINHAYVSTDSVDVCGNEDVPQMRETKSSAAAEKRKTEYFHFKDYKGSSANLQELAQKTSREHSKSSDSLPNKFIDYSSKERENMPHQIKFDTYRKKRSRCLIAIIIIAFLLVIGLAVFLGIYFGIMDKPDTVYKESQYEKGKFQTSMKINKPYDTAYANQNSPQYISMKTKLEVQLASMYQGSALKNDFQGVTVTGLSQGSIVVDYIITLNPNTVQTVSTVQQTTEQSVQQIKDDSSSSSDLIKAVDEVIVTAVIVSQTTTTTTTTTTTKAPTTTTTKATTTLVVTTEGAQPTTTTKATTAEVFTTEDAQPTTATSKAPTTISTKTTTEEDFTTEDAQPPTTTTKTPTTITTRATTEEDFTTEYAQAPTTTTKTPTTDVPSVSLSKVSYSVASGSVTLECSVTSTLAVTNVFWQRQVLGDIETINSQTNITKYSGSSTSNPSLTILNALPSDEGSYVCFASSSGGQGHSGITKLSVTGVGNPCTDSSLLLSPSLACVAASSGDLARNGITAEEKCSILMGTILSCIINKIKTDYSGRTCTEEQRHNIIVNNREDIGNMLNVDPMSCLPTSSCTDIEAITYYIPVICESQINSLRSLGSCSDFSDALKCYYYHVGIDKCDMTQYMNTVSNNYTKWIEDIKKPEPNTCNVDMDWIDPGSKVSLCSDPDAVHLIVNMYCPNDLKEFISASQDDKCMKASNLVVCIEQQLKAVLKATCTIDSIYQLISMYQTQIIGVSNQPSIQDCHIVMTTPAEEMTTMEEAMTTMDPQTTTATIVVVEGEFEANMKVNKTWDSKFEDKNSTEYKELTEKFRNQTLALYNYKNSSVEVEDIVILEVSKGSIVFVIVIILKKDSPNFRNWTSEKLIQETATIIEAVKKDPEVDNLDFVQTINTEEISVKEVTVVLTECDKNSYIKTIIHNSCDAALRRLTQVPDSQDRCRIFLQTIGCVVFNAQQCSVEKVTKTMTTHFQDIVSGVGTVTGFDPSSCYASVDTVVLPTMMPITSPVRPCVHPDVLSYILNFDCHYDAIPTDIEQGASMTEKCRFYWQSSACVYRMSKMNPLLQSAGACTYSDITSVLQQHASQLYLVKPSNVTPSDCYSYDRDQERCSSFLYDPEMYQDFDDCLYNVMKARFDTKLDTANLTCVLYEEATECVFRYYKWKGLDSCVKSQFESDLIWMINMRAAQWSQMMGMAIEEPEITQKCISNSTSGPNFGHSICGDGRGLILSRTECISEILMSQPSDTVCRTFEDRYIPCIMEKLSAHLNCTSDDIKMGILEENRLITKLSRGKVDLSSCMSMNETDICTSYKPEIVNFEDCSMAVYGFINRTVSTEVLCSGYNVFINCLSIKNGEKTGKMCKKSSLKTWLPVYLSAFTTVTETNIGACNVADDNVNYCNNVKEVETMAMVSGCTAFSQYLIHPSCQVWTPYIRCIAKMFPACRTDHVAYTLLNSSTIQGRVPQGYDVMESCFPSPDKTSSKFEITLTLDLPWKVEYADKNSQEYANFTRKVEEQVRALNQEYSSVIEYIKVIDVRSGSVVVVIELKYYLLIKVSDISSGTAQMIMAANRDPSSQFDLIKAGDPYSIIIEPKGDDSPVTGLCGSYNARVMNSTLCASAVYGFVNNTNVDQDLLCSAYNIYLNCLHLTVEKETGKDCKRSTLDTWMPAALPYMLNIPDSRFRSCDVDDDDVFLCGNVQLLEKMAFNSACAAYVQYLKNPSCSLVWTPYLKCIADIFPSCTINGVAQTLMTSANFRGLVPQGLDLITSCLPDESSSMFEITIKFDIPWKPEYSNTDSKEFTDLETRLVNQIMTAAGNNSAATDYLKVLELREGSVIAVFLIKYYYLLKTSDIKSGTVQMILGVRSDPSSQLDLVKVADPDSVIVVSKADDTTGSDDVCKVYSMEVMSVQTCIMALYGYMNTTNIDQDIFCRSYNIYLDCIHQTTEKNTDKKCARTSLNGWMPAILTSFLPNIQQSQIRSCNVNDEDLDSCHNTELIETMAMNSACFTGYGPSLQYPFCQIWLPFINCTAMTFPSCSIRDVAETLVKSNFTSYIPQGFDILTCLQDDTTDSDDVCKVLNIEVMSVQTCIMALYGFMNTTNIDQGIFCRSYTIYLDCIHHTVEESTNKKCARTSLNGWMPAILPSYLPNIPQSQIRSCNVNDDDLDSCHNTELIETMAMNSACFTGYGPSLQYPFCQIWLPFINCTAMSFPSCTIRDVAETLVKSNFTSSIPQGFDILTCVQVERSNLFEITIKYNITWMPAYSNLASTEAMALGTRLVQEIITYSGNTSAYFESLKVIELREGSVIAVFQLKYYNVVQLRTSEVKSGTEQMILQVRGDPKTQFDLLKVADPDSVIVKSKTDKNQTTDVCAVISENIVFPDACGIVWLSVYNKTNIDQDFLCSIYEIYLDCIQSAQEERTGKECKRTSLASWIPNTILAFLPNIKDTQLRACSISNDKDICNDPKTLEVAAVNTTCSIAIFYFHFTPKISCRNVTDYFDCLDGFLPQCDKTDMVKKIVELPVFKAVVPDHFEALHCYGGGGDVCLNYTNYMYVQDEEDCTEAIGQVGQQDPFGLLCQKYNVYLSCVTTNIKESHQCEKFSLHTWLPGYIDKRYNISGADRCNVTDINYCNDIYTLELMINTTKCGYYLDIMASYPSCLNARMFLECMGGLFPGCDEYMFAQTMVNSIIKNRIPQTFNPMACFGVSGPSKFVAEVKINATWDKDLSSTETSKYRQLKSTIEQQARMLFSNKVLFLKDHIESIDVLSFKPGSIIVEFAVIIKMNSDFYKTLQLEDFRQELLRAIKELKMNPTTAPNYFTSVDVDSINITGSDDGNQEVSTPSTTTLAPDCNSMMYISSIVDSQCESSKSRLRMVDKDRKCSVLLDMIGCVLFQTRICNKEQIVSTMSRDSWSMIGQNISVFDPISCFGPGNEVVLPTIVPLNVTLMPCVHPDVVHYILNYDCYYYGLQEQMQGDDKLDSCRMYWYSSACLYGTLQTNKDKLGQCSLEEVNGVLTKYEDELFKVSPDNVTMSECLGLYKSADKCTRAMYSDDVFTIVQTCYGTAVANRMTAAYGIMDLSDYPCLIYQEMTECLYRPIKEHQLCLANQTEVMEDHMIWLTNGLNDIMTLAMGSPLNERKTVEKCIANVTKTPDFGQDLCDDGAGLIMSEITCLYYIGNPVCNSLESAYIPCLSNGLSRKRIFCSAERIWRSLSVVSDLFGKLTQGRVDISSCNRDTGSKQGTCPAVGNHTVGICVEECSGDYNCTGNQKCCSNGCGHVCMDPDSKNDSGRFNITIRFDLDWRPEYREENSTFRTTLTNELNKIIASSELKAYLKYIRVMVLRPGSIIAGCEAEFDKDIAEHKLEMTLKTRIEEIQDDPEYTILQKWSNLSVEILPESEDVCTDVTKIARELQVCSSYLNYTQFKDNRTNCGLYNYFLNCVVSSVTANRQKCTRDSLEGIMQTVFESIGRSDLKALLNCSGQGSVYFRADLEYMKRVIRSHFSDTRHHAPQYSAYKQTAKQFIFDEFQRFGLDTEYHTFNDTEVSSTATFQSVIGVLKGTRFGTADDLISGLGAHYDTVNTSKGVDDNGSGVAAMLEVVRQITNINNSGYKSKNTIIFVSFDLEEYGGLSGSRNFLQDWLTPWLIKNYGSTIPEKLQGVIILDTIMEYNTSSQSQVFPLGALDQFQQFFPSAVESILSDDARGDFISLIYRQPTDDRVLAETFDSSWAAAGRSEFEIESFGLPFADLSSVPQENLALMYQFLRSDHANFWEANLPAIFLTDSANFRGDMIQCYHNPCDDLDTMLTDDNVNFLGKIADTVTATIHRLSEPFIPEDVDGICEDSMLMELIVNQSCTSYLQGFQNQSSCQALSSMVDRCLSPLMPGVTCDRNRMLSHVVTMVMVAKMLPVGFNISTCGSANHSNNAKQSISDMCLGQWGSCASQQDCHMVTWSYNLNTQMISFNVTAAIDSDKWMGVGFNGQKEMAGSDALVGWITPQATVTVTDRNNPSYYGSFLDTTQNVKNAAWDRMNGITSISFQRHRDTNDTSDFIFSEDNCAYFIYPMGGSYDENDKSINRHSKTPTISLKQFCFPCADVCTSKELFRKMGSTECKSQVDSFKESDDFLTFCGKLQRITECLQTNLPTHGCSSTIKDSTYPVLITLLSELVGFDTMSKAISCSSAA